MAHGWDGVERRASDGEMHQLRADIAHIQMRIDAWIENDPKRRQEIRDEIQDAFGKVVGLYHKHQKVIYEGNGDKAIMVRLSNMEKTVAEFVKMKWVLYGMAATWVADVVARHIHP